MICQIVQLNNQINLFFLTSISQKKKKLITENTFLTILISFKIGNDWTISACVEIFSEFKFHVFRVIIFKIIIQKQKFIFWKTVFSYFLPFLLKNFQFYFNVRKKYCKYQNEYTHFYKETSNQYNGIEANIKNKNIRIEFKRNKKLLLFGAEHRISKNVNICTY